jgi:hypothetical protein
MEPLAFPRRGVPLAKFLSSSSVWLQVLLFYFQRYTFMPFLHFTNFWWQKIKPLSSKEDRYARGNEKKSDIFSCERRKC